MSCGHGWHACGPWYGPDDWYEEFDRPVRRRYPRHPRPDAVGIADDLEARLSALRDEIRRAEADLAELRGGDEALAERP